MNEDLDGRMADSGPSRGATGGLVPSRAPHRLPHALRLLKWVLLVLCAALAGWVVRQARRLAEVWAQIYARVWWGAELQLDRARHFSPERKPRPFCEDSACSEFWPVPVADLMPEISAALRGFALAERAQQGADPC